LPPSIRGPLRVRRGGIGAERRAECGEAGAELREKRAARKREGNVWAMHWSPHWAARTKPPSTANAKSHGRAGQPAIPDVFLKRLQQLPAPPYRSRLNPQREPLQR